MFIKKINTNELTRALNRAGLVVKKHSPEIMVVTGVIGMCLSTVLACREMTRAEEVLSTSKSRLDTIKEISADPEKADKYFPEDAKKDTVTVYTQTGIELAKLFAPAVIVGTLSAGLIFTSTNILKKRNLAIAAAYSVLDTGFKDYRRRVVDRFGENVDVELRHDLKVEQVKETVIDEETGKKKKVTREELSYGSLPSIYARFFDDQSRNWAKEEFYNQTFLTLQQNYANHLLVSRGHLFLNEVYDNLDIPRTKEGSVVGWIYKPGDTNRDNFVSFGLNNPNSAGTREFVNGNNNAVLLDFNVDGVIYDQI